MTKTLTFDDDRSSWPPWVAQVVDMQTRAFEKVLNVYVVQDQVHDSYVVEIEVEHERTKAVTNRREVVTATSVQFMRTPGMFTSSSNYNVVTSGSNSFFTSSTLPMVVTSEDRAEERAEDKNERTIRASEDSEIEKVAEILRALDRLDWDEAGISPFLVEQLTEHLGGYQESIRHRRQLRAKIRETAKDSTSRMERIVELESTLLDIHHGKVDPDHVLDMLNLDP